MAMIWSQNTITAYGTIALLSHHPALVISSIPSHSTFEHDVREMRMNRTRLLALSTMLILLAPSLATIRSADAQSYPTRPVKMVVPYPPGGPNDVMARILAQKLSEALGNQFYVENQPGAGGSIAAGAVANAAA